MVATENRLPALANGQHGESRRASIAHSYSEIERMGVVIAKSGLFGIKTPEQAVALMLIAQAEGLHPAIAARDYHVIQGRPTLKADAMLARFQESGGKVEWHKYTDDCVSATFSHPSGGPVPVTWDMERAKQAGLLGKDNWNKYPRQMLRARVISEGVRTVSPGCTVGVYTPEEVGDFEHEPKHEPMKQPEPPEPKPAPEPPKKPLLSFDEIKAVIEALPTTEKCESAGPRIDANTHLTDYQREQLHAARLKRMEQLLVAAKPQEPPAETARPELPVEVSDMLAAICKAVPGGEGFAGLGKLEQWESELDSACAFANLKAEQYLPKVRTAWLRRAFATAPHAKDFKAVAETAAKTQLPEENQARVEEAANEARERLKLR